MNSNLDELCQYCSVGCSVPHVVRQQVQAQQRGVQGGADLVGDVAHEHALNFQ